MTQISQMGSFLDFLDLSPSPYHAVDWFAKQLTSRGFTELFEKEPWEVADKTKCFVRRGGKALIAWVPGRSPVVNAGFRIVGAHSDSPALKPRSNRIEKKFGLPVLENSIYGSPILPTWLDRECGIAGLVFLRNDQEGQLFVGQSINLRTSSLAIHLDKGSREEGLKLNPHTNMNCLVSSDAYRDNSDLFDLIADEINVRREEIINFDLNLFDRQLASHLAGNPGLISAGRLDNLFSCFCSTTALMEMEKTTDSTSVVALFDSEEIGSRSWNGAQGTFLTSTLERISYSAPGVKSTDVNVFHRAIASSSFVSVDMAHANHPMYSERLSELNAPNINEGVAIKKSDRGHYAMSGKLEAQIRRTCTERGVPLQEFRYREDLGGGTSIGPLVAAGLGIESIDVGVGLLGMHSAREVVGASDLKHCVEFSKATFLI